MYQSTTTSSHTLTHQRHPWLNSTNPYTHNTKDKKPTPLYKKNFQPPSKKFCTTNPPHTTQATKKPAQRLPQHGKKITLWKRILHFLHEKKNREWNLKAETHCPSTTFVTKLWVPEYRSFELFLWITSPNRLLSQLHEACLSEWLCQRGSVCVLFLYLLERKFYTNRDFIFERFFFCIIIVISILLCLELDKERLTV